MAGASNSPVEASDKVVVRNALKKRLVVSSEVEFISMAPR
jgi:hypothetical protein